MLPADVGLRDAAVGGGARALGGALVLRSVAAAGLAVRLLTQGVGEAVVTGAQKHERRRMREREPEGERETDRRTERQSEPERETETRERAGLREIETERARERETETERARQRRRQRVDQKQNIRLSHSLGPFPKKCMRVSSPISWRWLGDIMNW